MKPFGQQRYQPTYEELKRQPPAQLAVLQIGYQPTYEELKPSFLNIFFVAPRRYQPTYEELKPFNQVAG